MPGTRSSHGTHASLLKDLFPVILPLVLFGSAIGVIKAYPEFASWSTSPTLRNLPYVTAAISMLLGFFFAQTRISFMSVLLALMVYLLDQAAFVTSDVEGVRALVFLSSIYFPCVVALFYHLHERGILTPRGYIKIAIVCSFAVVMVLLPRVDSLRRAVATAQTSLVRAGPGIVRVPLVGVAVFGLGAVALCWRNRRESPLLGPVLIAALLFVFAGLNFESGLWPEGSARSVFLCFMAGAGLVLAWAVMESGWRHAHIDELTQLPGRRSLQHHLAKLGSSYALAVLDLDHFKRVNDRHGHDIGDQVLKFAAAMMKKNRAGRAYRQGGEEFVIVCEGGDYEAAVEALEELRESIRTREFVIRGRDRPRKKPENSRAGRGGRGKLAVSVSIGVARRNKKFATPGEVLEAADRALYRAKKAGRNCVKATK